MSISIYQVALEVAKGVMVKPESARSLPIYLPTVARKHDSFLHYHEDALAPALRTQSHPPVRGCRALYECREAVEAGGTR